MSDDIDDFEDIFDEIKKFFDLNSRLFDMDFYLFPEFNKNTESKKKGSKGFKVSYHFETGMDEPEIKVEGDIDEEELHKLLKNTDLNNIRKFKIKNKPSRKGLLNAKDLYLVPDNIIPSKDAKEPFTEVCYHSDCTELIIEVPGIETNDITIEFNAEGDQLIFSATNANRNYVKKIDLPFKTSKKQYDLEVNNGVIVLKIWRD
ncbi:MAG: hypothetical protein ACFFAO_07380 [Candidatus Hermodarchaeota archaeon]